MQIDMLFVSILPHSNTLNFFFFTVPMYLCVTIATKLWLIIFFFSTNRSWFPVRLIFSYHPTVSARHWPYKDHRELFGVIYEDGLVIGVILINLNMLCFT